MCILLDQNQVFKSCFTIKVISKAKKTKKISIGKDEDEKRKKEEERKKSTQVNLILNSIIQLCEQLKKKLKIERKKKIEGACVS